MASHPGPARRADRPKPPAAVAAAEAPPVEPETPAAEPESSAVESETPAAAAEAPPAAAETPPVEPEMSAVEPETPVVEPESSAAAVEKDVVVAPVDAVGEPAAQSEPMCAAPDAQPADASTHEEPVTDTMTPPAGGSEADATAGLAADDAELPTFAE